MHSTTIERTPAREAGALDGWTVVCSCGTRLGSAFLRQAESLWAEHIGWHDRRGY